LNKSDFARRFSHENAYFFQLHKTGVNEKNRYGRKSRINKLNRMYCSVKNNTAMKAHKSNK